MSLTIKADLYRYNGKKGIQIIQALRTPGFRWTFCFRLYQNSKCLKFFYRLFLTRYSVKYGFQINRYAQIGAGLYLPHYGGIVINADTVIGKNCDILQGVTIGHTKRGDKKGTPTIGSHVYIGPNAVIVGKITIGNNVLIAPLSYVNFDVPDNSIVIGNPAKIISRSNATEGYIKNTI